MKKIAKKIIGLIVLTVLMTLVGCTGQIAESVDLEEAESPVIVDLKDGDTFDLQASVVAKTINGNTYTMYAYNGMIPGPILRVAQNSTIHVNFTNLIPLNTTVHWHGLRHDFANDGVPKFTQTPMKTGDSFEYEVYFPDDGVFWYHPHIREDIEQDLGLSGVMLAMPTLEYSNVNKEEVLVLDDILVDDEGEMVAHGVEHANYAMMGRFGNVMLVNGETDYRLSVNQGDVIRFYVTNVANVRPFNLSFDGAKMKLVGGDIGLYEQEEFVESVVISPAERYIVEVYFSQARNYAIVNKNPHQTYALGIIDVSSDSAEPNYYNSFETLRTNNNVVEDVARFEPHFNKEPDYIVDLSVEMSMPIMDHGSEHGALMHNMEGMPCHQMPDGSWMGDCEDGHIESDIEWEDGMEMMNAASTTEDVRWILRNRDNGLENMNFAMTAKVGDVVKIRLFNDPHSDHPMQHPIHLHGQRFLILEQDGVKTDNFVWKDTVLVPKGSTVDILVDVTNPGEWMIHCHIAEHLEAGMMSAFVVTE